MSHDRGCWSCGADIWEEHAGWCVNAREQIKNKTIGELEPTMDKVQGVNKIEDTCWLETYTGKKFYIMNPSVKDVDIKDIAHALSNMCRFGGHTKHFYSVAQHSLAVYSHLRGVDNKNYALQLVGLLHDASEAYLVDIPTPIKSNLNNYKAIEKNIQNTIYFKFLGRLPTEEENILCKYYDKLQLWVEGYQLMPSKTEAWIANPEFKQRCKQGFTIYEASLSVIKENFLYNFNSLTRLIKYV